MERERKIRLIVGGLFVVLLLIGIILITQPEVTKITPKINFYSSSSISANVIKNYDEGQKIYRTSAKEEPIKKVYSKGYSSWGEHTKTKTLGLYSDAYEVHLHNREGGRTYIVEYTFSDYFGNKRVYEIEKYVFGYEDEIFRFRDISKDMTYYNTWKYRVLLDE